MFSASDYVQRRYAKAEEQPAELAVQRLQSIVDASGLKAHEALVEALLNVLTSPDELDLLTVVSLRTWFLRAAAIRQLGEQWEKTLIGYAGSLEAGAGLDPTTFYSHCVGAGILPIQDAEEGTVAVSKPLVVVGQPVVTMTKGSGLKGTIRYINKDEITIGAGLFEVVAAIRMPASARAASKVGVLQFVSSDRLATYSDGTKLTRAFDNALDTGERPWLKGTSVTVAPGQTAVLVVNDAPKWNVPLQDETNRRLVGITINDTFTSYVAVLAEVNKFVTRYTCDWTFAATYSVASPGAATQSYVVTPAVASDGVITLTGREELANGFPDKVSK